jgi:hypothetical protein
MDLETQDGDNGDEQCAKASVGVSTGGSTQMDEEKCDDDGEAVLEFESDGGSVDQDLSIAVRAVEDVRFKYRDERRLSELVTINELSFEEETIGTCVRRLRREECYKVVFGAPENISCTNY